MNSSKITASYLKEYDRVKIQWTDCLSDHLLLMRERDWKHVLVFHHAGFAHVSLQWLKKQNTEVDGVSGALQLGCLPQKLLFPESGDEKSMRLLQRELDIKRTDPFLGEFHDKYRRSEYENPREAFAPVNLKTLHANFKYFGEWLEQLWEEADDSTPTSNFDRLLDSRKNPCFTYWCAIVAISIAITFGILAAGIGAVQIWITWCTWMDDPTVAQCGYKKPSTTAAA